MKEVKSILIVAGFPDTNEQEALNHYTKNVGTLLVDAGGKPISKYTVKEKLHGEHSLATIFIAEFPNDGAIKEFFNTDAYKALLPYRNKAFKSINIYIAN